MQQMNYKALPVVMEPRNSYFFYHTRGVRTDFIVQLGLRSVTRLKTEKLGRKQQI